jgi:hypothetical protein
MRFVATGQERRTKSTNVLRAALTMGTISRYAVIFYAFFLVKSSYRYSLVRIFPTSSSKKAPNASALTF